MTEKIYSCARCKANGRSIHPVALMMDPTDDRWAFLRFSVGQRSIIVCAECFEGYRLARFTDRIAGPADRRRVVSLLLFTLEHARTHASLNDSLNDMLMRAVLSLNGE